MKQKIIGLVVLVSLGVMCSCGARVTDETDVEETVEIERDVTRLTTPIVETEPVEPRRTTEATVEVSDYDPNETYFVPYTQQTEPWEPESLFDISQLSVPDHDYAENRVNITLDVFTQDYEGYLWVGEGFQSLRIAYTDWHDDTVHEGQFILDGIILPGEDDNSFLTDSLYMMLNRMCQDIDGLYVYVETDGVVDENGAYHGFIYFNPVIDNVLYGQVGWDTYTDLTQLNEWLLAHGFAAPDRNYVGLYADIYQQYPDFNDDFYGYPLILPEGVLGDYYDFNFIYFDPSVPEEAYSEYGYYR